MSTRLVSAASRLLDSKTDRRGFLRRAALVGTALVAAPATYIFRPVTAYAAVVPGDCGSGAKCTDGWTEFCSNIHGVNTCPPGSMVAGWWRAQGNGYCDGNHRYYMDCNASSCSCGCGGSGTCSHTCTSFSCQCANESCGNRKASCTRFRYGQCNRHEACLGPIVCRVVTCIPPWEWDSSCSTTVAVSQSTITQGSPAEAPGLHPDSTPKGPYPARPAIVTGSTWQLRNGLSSGGANASFDFGVAGDTPLMADFSNSGVRTAAMVRNAREGVARETELEWYIRQVEGPGAPDLVVKYGQPGDIPVIGDWNGNGVHTIGVVRGNRWLLRNSLSSGDPNYDFTFDGDGQPVTGDWNGNGGTGVGWFDSGTWHIRNALSSGGAEDSFDFGNSNGIAATWGRNA